MHNAIIYKMKLYGLKMAWANLMSLQRNAHPHSTYFYHSFPNTYHPSIEVMRTHPRSPTPKCSALIATPTPRKIGTQGRRAGAHRISLMLLVSNSPHLHPQLFTCVISFVGIYRRDLRTNHFKEEKDDVNLRNLSWVQRHPRCPWIVGGLKKNKEVVRRGWGETCGVRSGVQEELDWATRLGEVCGYSGSNHPTGWTWPS